VSAATVWEIGIKRANGKLEAPTGLARAIAEEGFGELPVTAGTPSVRPTFPDIIAIPSTGCSSPRRSGPARSW
jgi:PIN domain nuclease of toxin-antitoxin system